MIKDYFERKKIYFSDSYGNLCFGIFCAFLIIIFNVLSFVFVAVVWTSIDAVKAKKIRKIDQLLPFSREEKTKRFLLDTGLNLFFLAIPLVINVCIMSSWQMELKVLQYPVYGIATFLSFFVLLFHDAMNCYYIGCSGIDRVKKRCETAGFLKKTHEVFYAVFRTLLIGNILLVYLDLMGIYWIQAEDAPEIAMLVLVFTAYELIDIVRTVRCGYEH